MIPAPHSTTAAAVAAPARVRTSPVPRIKFSSRGFMIDHPDPEAGDRLMAEALGVDDREAMHGILTQLVQASMSGGRPNRTSLDFMLTMVRSIAPRDPIEAMLVSQMVCVHVMAMRCARQLAGAEDIVQRDGASLALGRLARIFPAQVEALSRHRNKGEAAITVQNLSVQDGGKAIVGHVTQHAHVIVSELAAAAARATAQPAATPASGAPQPDAVDATAAGA